MDSALKNLSKSDLIALLAKKDSEVQKTLHLFKKSEQRLARAQQKATCYQTENIDLQAQLAWFKRQLFGQKRERFESDPEQGLLPFEATDEQRQEQEDLHEETVTYVRKKHSRARHKGRLPLPDHLPVEEIEIYPEGDLSQMSCIGKEVTEELELAPARFYIKRYIRYKYAPKAKDADGVVIGELPERVIDKGIPGPGLLATILVDKFMDHLPLYRQRQRFLRENIPIAASTIDGWAAQAMDRLQILYNHLVADTKATGYLQADEVPIKVLETRNKGSCHQGYYWVYRCAISQAALFDYQPSRGSVAAKSMLDDFTGYLQTDGYSAYKDIAKEATFTHLFCWAHAR